MLFTMSIAYAISEGTNPSTLYAQTMPTLNGRLVLHSDKWHPDEILHATGQAL